MLLIQNTRLLLGRQLRHQKLPKLAESVKEKLQEKLRAAKFVSITIDIWTDRRMRAYLGCTVHFIIHESDSGNPVLASGLLCIERFTGSHTGEKIADRLEKVVDEFNIRDKLIRVKRQRCKHAKSFLIGFP